MSLRHILGAALALLAGAVGALAAPIDPRPDERGLPLMRLYDDTDHGGAPQNFAIAMDQRGYVYVGNLQGVLISDGARWRKALSDSAVFAIGVAPSGQVLVGGPQTLLLLEPGSHGAPTLRSITGLLPPADRSFGDVHTIVGTSHAFVILTDSRLLQYQAGVLKTVAELPPDRKRSLFLFRGEAVLTGEGRSERVRDGALVEAPDLAPLDGFRVDALLAHGEKAYLACLRGVGLVRVDELGLTRVAGPTSDWISRNEVTSALRLRDGRVALGSRMGGLLLANDAGDAEQIIDSSRGLPNDQVVQLGEDRDGGLWLVMSGGLARFDVASPITVFDGRSGMPVGAQGIYRHKGRLFVFGATGLGVMERGSLRKIPGVAGSTWFGLETPGKPDEFLMAAASGLFRVKNDRATLLPGTADMGAYTLARARNFDGIFVGARGGLYALHPEGGGYRLSGPIAGSPRYVRSMVPRESGRLFMATTFDGVVVADVDAENPGGAKFRKLGGVETDIHEGPGGLIVISNDERAEVFQVDEKTPRLVPDVDRTNALAGLTAWATASDASGNLWVNTNALRIFPRVDGALTAVPTVLYSFPARRIQMIKPEPDGVVWVCGESGLFRHAGSPHALAAPPTEPVLASLTVDDEMIFDGWDDHAQPPAELPQTLRRFHAEFGALSHQRGISFQFRLDPLDGDWSEWSPRTDVEFTTLQEASYRFRVRARGVDGQIGPELVWSFVVNPPWHRTLAARFGSAFALLMLLAGAILLRTRVLRREAERLAAKVEERTRDLQAAVRELEDSRRRVEEQNRLLEQANARLEEVSRHDSLTGIANRRQFDAVLQEEWLRARRHRTPLAIGILDLDHFKELNDALGHPEGDDALRQVAKTLQALMRRPTDLVARYGGEEFGFILSNTDLAGALMVAEEVRAHIEALGLRNPGSSSGHLTASVGLVAAIPVDGMSREKLIEAADRELYAAKADGRNRVRAREVTTD